MVEVLDGLPVAVDAMGGDRAPDEVVAGARQAANELGIPVLLVGDPARIGRPEPEAGRSPCRRRHRSSKWTRTRAGRSG